MCYYIESELSYKIKENIKKANNNPPFVKKKLLK